MVRQVVGSMSSSEHDGSVGYPTFRAGTIELIRVSHLTERGPGHKPSGSQTILLSSSYSAKSRGRDDPATTSCVLGSNATLIYDLPFRTRRLGNGVCRSTLGSSSTRQGPCADDKLCFCQKEIGYTYLLSIHQEIVRSLDRRAAGKRVHRVIRGRNGCQIALVRFGKPRWAVSSKEHSVEPGCVITSG